MYNGINFTDPASVLMESLISLHHDLQFYLLIVLVFTCWMLAYLLYVYFYKFNVIRKSIFIESLELRSLNWTSRNILHNSILEFFWTVFPTLILIVIALPSFALLFSMDQLVTPTLTIKIFGYQWFWAYEYCDYLWDVAFFSNIVPLEDLEEVGSLRLYEVDNVFWLPTTTPLRIIVSSNDVLHCWAIPSLAIKVDAVPGRLNQGSIYLKREGTFFGQCSELCGASHAFMPIVLKSVSFLFYNFFISTFEDVSSNC